MTKIPADDAVRSRLWADLESTFVVEAAAGTGKTTVLVSRIVRVVQTGRARLSQVISVTFTEKAAGEMKLRLRAQLERERGKTQSEEERARLTDALEELEVARIGTIHGLCADFLREYPVEAGVDPLFEVAAEADSEAILHTAFHRQFQELLRRPPEGVRRMLRRRSRNRDEAPPRRQLLDAVNSLIEHRDFDAPWRRDPFDRDPLIDSLAGHLEALAALSLKVRPRSTNRSASWFFEQLLTVRRFVDDLHHREKVAPRDHDGLEAQLRELASNRYRWENPAYGVLFEGTTEAAVLAARSEVWTELQRFVRLADADLAACLHLELRPVVEAYEAEKARRGVLDFVDLLLKTRDLVRDVASVRAELQRRFTQLFVDEFQDTDPLQSELVLLLAADDPAETRAFHTRCVPGKLFVVGDPKQSIYRFRRADVALYERVKQHLLGHGAQLEYLSTSFRSTPGIQAAVNAAFEKAMRPSPGSKQATYVALGASREATEGQPSLIALPAPRPFAESGKPTKDQVEKSLPEAVGAFIAWLVHHSGWTVEEVGERVPVEPRHVCILFKRLRRYGGLDVPRPYAQALEARRVPHVLVGGRSFHVREEVMALRTALVAIDRPDDELSVFATLRGPFFAFSDQQLLVFRHEVGKFQPLRPFEGMALSPLAAEVAEALGMLRALHFKRNHQPAASTLHEFLEATRAHAGVAFWTAGQQALANVLQLAEVTRRLEQRSTSFRDVVESLQEEAEEGEAPDAPIVEEGTDGVRMMTVHAAKGLEFPVVILAEPTANTARVEPSHHVDVDRKLWVHALAGCIPSELREHEAEVLERDLEEALRLTYVAATRARDLLVVPVSSEKQFPDTWTSVLDLAVWPAPESVKNPRAAPGCPALGKDVVLDRQGSIPDAVPIPGRHLALSRRNGVVWWGATALELDQEERSGLENSEALADDPVSAPQARAEYERWRGAHAEAIEAGSRPRFQVRVARELTLPPAPGVIGLASTPVERSARPSGRRFGELVHAAMAHVALDASPAIIASVVAVHARALLATDEERAAAAVAVEQALAHPLLAEARAALEVRREDPVVDRLPGGDVLEGTIDLAYRTATGWTVVEFKTDEDLASHRPEYEAQTAAYVHAIGAATGLPARGLILQL